MYRHRVASVFPKFSMQLLVDLTHQTTGFSPEIDVHGILIIQVHAGAPGLVGQAFCDFLTAES